MEVKSARDIVIQMDCLVGDLFADEIDALILPGGLPGAHHLRDNDAVQEIIQDVNSLGKIVAAICAAPVALERAGIIEDKKVTSHPSKEDELQCCEEYTNSRVQVDGNVITSRGPGTSLEFAYEICNQLGLQDKVEELKAAMMFK